MSYIMRIVGRVDGESSSFDGQFLVEYDPSPSSMNPGECILVTSPDITRAKTFIDKIEALEEWKRVDQRHPIRPWDGRPNRPLTAFSVSIEPR